MLEEKTSYQVTVTQTKTLQVLTITEVYKNGELFGSPQNHRVALQIGEDLSNQPEIVKQIANAVWTPDVIQKYEMEKKQNEMVKG